VFRISGYARTRGPGDAAPSLRARSLARIHDLEAAVDRLGTLRFVTIVRDLAYAVGVVALLRSIRQTAVANDHWQLRDAASTVTGLMVGLGVLDVLYQLVFGQGTGRSAFPFAIIGLIGGLSLVGFWIYCHLRLAKFLKAASILVHEPHNLPVATLVVREKPVDPVPAPTRQSGPIIGAMAPVVAPSEPIRPSPVAADVATTTSAASQPVIAVAAELRAAPTPRADPQPDARVDEPKLLR